MKAVVVIPPVFDFYFTPHRASGLGAEIVLSLLRDKGWAARRLDFPGQSKKSVKRDLPAAMHYLKPYLIEGETGKLSFFKHYQRFGPSLATCVEQTLADGPAVIFISCFAFCYADTTIEFAERLRQSDPRPTIVCGGAGVSAWPEYFMLNPAIDFAVTGEAEVSLPRFLDALATGTADFARVPNLFWKTNGHIQTPLQIRRTDSPAIRFVFKKTNETSNTITYTTALSRGCPRNCRFCSNFISQGRSFRTVLSENIKAGLAAFDGNPLAQGKQVFINIEDDNFLCDPDFFFAILDRFKAVFPQAEFLAENGLDHTLITSDILERLIGYGMKQFNLSLMSADQRLLDGENRQTDLGAYEYIVNKLKKNDIPVITYFICGLRDDSPDRVVDTLVYLAGVPTRVGISLFYPVPGIPGFQERGIFKSTESCLWAGASAYPWNGSLDTRQMVTAFRLARFVNLVKTRQRTDEGNTLVEISFREGRLFTLMKTGRERKPVPVPNLDDDMAGLFFKRYLSTLS